MRRLTVKALLSHVRRRKLRAQLAVRRLIRVCPGPLPLGEILAIRNAFETPDVLEPHPSSYLASGRELSDGALSEWLGDEELGMWTMAAETLEAIGNMVAATRPGLILEFGSGVSTLCLCQFMRVCGYACVGPAVVSVEQNEEYAQRTRKLISEHGLSDLCEILHAPILPCEYGGETSTCYSIDASQLRSALAGRGVDLLVVDGPAGDRFPTLLSVSEHLSPGATVVLDDAWRDAELEVAQRWSSLPSLSVEGILPVGKGLLLAKVIGGDNA